MESAIENARNRTTLPTPTSDTPHGVRGTTRFPLVVVAESSSGGATGSGGDTRWCSAILPWIQAATLPKNEVDGLAGVAPSCTARETQRTRIAARRERIFTNPPRHKVTRGQGTLEKLSAGACERTRRIRRQRVEVTPDASFFSTSARSRSRAASRSSSHRGGATGRCGSSAISHVSLCRSASSSSTARRNSAPQSPHCQDAGEIHPHPPRPCRARNG